MSSGTVTPPPLPAEPQPEKPSYEAFIEQRLRQTRRQVKGVDLAAGLVLLAVGTLAYLLAAVVIDHWVISGGLGFWGRLLLLLGLLAGAGYYFGRYILMSVIRRINPIFAAHTIEQSRPSLKNSLINFLLLRGHRREVPQPVYQAIEHRAAADLSQIEIEAAVDRTHVIRLGYVLAGMVAVCCLYLVLSPKSLFNSAARVLWPWSGIPAPTRVTIGVEDVKPGDAVAFHGEFVTVSAKVRGVRGDAVELYYSTADGQNVDQRITMVRPEDGYRHEYRCRLPLEQQGLQQDVSYYLTAGDCRTRQFRIDVQTAPTILVDSIEYDYPDYTGLSDRVVKQQGDVRAIEGTRLTIRAAANRTIDKRKGAKIDLGCDGLREVDMQPAGKTATGSFTLRLDPNNPTRPEHDCYQLRFVDDAGRLNPRPTQHRIEVIPDLPPEIQLIDPQQEEVQLAEGGQLEIRVRAQDPDFALQKVVLRAECGGRSLVIPPMFPKNVLEKVHQGEFQGSYLFDAAGAKFEADSSGPVPGGLKAGDRVRYWAEAEDNKQPVPGRATTAQQWIAIVKPPSPQPSPEQSEGTAQDAQKGSQGGQDQPPDHQPDEDQQPREGDLQEPAEKPQAGEQPPQDDGSSAQDQKPGAADEQQPGEPVDSETQPGDAIEKILEHREQEQKEKGEQETGEPQPGEKGSGSEKSGEPQPGEKGSGGEKSGEPQPGEKGSGGEKSGEPQQGEKGSGGEKSGEPQVGREPDSQQSPGGGKPSSDPTGPPESQGRNLDREKKPGQPGQNPDEEQPAESPSISRHQSDSQGDTSGDRSGGGEEGGGQRSKQPGIGAAGSQTAADDGGSAGKQRGEGQTGNRGGDQVETDRQTGSSAARRGGSGSEGRQQPGGVGPDERQSDGNDSGGAERPQENPDDGGRPSDGASSGPNARGHGNPTAGGGPGQQPDGGPPRETGEPGGVDPNLEYARKATDLALEHLKDQMDQDDSDLLDRLGWSPEEAKRFIEKWEQMKRAAARQDPEGEEARGQLDRALKSLGVRPRGTQLRGGGTGPERLPGLREAGRFDPPGDWAELYRAYKRGVASEGRR
jgi:hypothetical protein